MPKNTYLNGGGGGGYEVFYEHILQKAQKETQFRPKTL